MWHPSGFDVVFDGFEDAHEFGGAARRICVSLIDQSIVGMDPCPCERKFLGG
jgi:hypothetical protein